MIEDLTGKIFGRLKVLQKTYNHKQGHRQYICECTCGKYTIVTASRLNTGKTKSCGCLAKEQSAKNWKKNKTHGLTKHSLHRVWLDMRNRCSNSNHYAYKYYGDRGIIVCDEWENFKIFYDFAIQKGWKKGLQIDRINNNGNYKPSNCRFVSARVNANNRRKPKKRSM